MSEFHAPDVLGLLPLCVLSLELVDVLVSTSRSALGLGSLLLGSGRRVGSDGGVDGLVESLEALSTESFFPVGELLLEFLLVVLFEVVVVSLDVATEDMGLVFLGVERALGSLSLHGFTSFVGDNLSLGNVEARESLLLVGNVETTVASTFQGAEDTVSSGSADETDIEAALEGASVVLNLFGDRVHGTINLVVSLVHVSHTLGGEESTRAEETSSVGSGVVGKSSLESVSAEFLGVGRSEAVVTGEGGVDDLADNSLVGLLTQNLYFLVSYLSFS